ncbi:MAG: amidohydrolase [Acidobacteriota bacterium]|nr:amidohydrolase [Acidobacteriota bacterium]
MAPDLAAAGIEVPMGERSLARSYCDFGPLADFLPVPRFPGETQTSSTIPAIDFMYYVATEEFMRKWDEAKKGELLCRMERAIGGLPRYPSIEAMLALMDEANVQKVFITQCKMWSYWRKWMYMDTQLDEVLQYTERYPDRFVGLAGYNPFRIRESLKEIETAVTKHGFKGVYIHIYGFDIGIDDRKMYPMYALCEGLGVPVSLQVGHVLEAMPSEGGRPMLLDRVACDFPNLKLIGAHTGWPWVDELLSVCYKWDNIWFGIDAWMPKYLAPQIVQFLGSRLGRDRCLWGTNGLPWKESLAQVEQLGLKEEVKRKLLHDNAVEVFGLAESSASG